MDNPPSLNKELATQLKISGASEMIGMSVAVGSVLLARKALPEHTRRMETMFARWIGRWRGEDAASMAQAGAKATDFLLMNIGGAANMASQFMLHRLRTPEQDKLPMSQEAWRVVTGRAAGTLGAASAVALAEYHAGGTLRHIEQTLGHQLPLLNGKIAPLMVSSLIQSVGALGPNAGAQVLFDHLTARRPPEEGKSA